MFKKLIFIFLLTLFFNQPVKAESIFAVDANVEYKVLESGSTAVTHTITITNNSTYDYAKSYLFELSNLEPKNLKAFEEGSPIPSQLKKEDEKYTLDFNFTTPLTGKGRSRTFIITYEEENLALHSGEVWEVSVPKLINKYDNYKVTLSVPASFGEEALISPEFFQKTKDGQRFSYIFDGRELERSGVNAVFGKFQTYSLRLNYHLKNDTDKRNVTYIAIPPDTSTQRVIYTNITPSPINIRIDEDGNWLAYFELLPKKDQLVVVEGYAQVFANPIKFLSPYPSTILDNLKSQEYWEADDPKIKEIALHLKTPRAIYNFVTDILTYNYDRVKPGVERLGAKKALNMTNDATCTEFTDLFIALARAAGIPAREINGYAHSDNPKLQPLSLISDVLHSWPEYWDENAQNWIPVDPTWESTSKIDYFNKFDLKHIAFVIHGTSPTHPPPAGSYKSDDLKKDVFVEFSTLPEDNRQSIDISHQIKNSFNPFTKKLIINLKNTGTLAYYNVLPKISYFDEDVEVEVISVLPPFATHSISVDLPVGIFSVKSPNLVSVSADHTQKSIYLNKTSFATQQLLVFLSVLLIFMIFLGIKFKKINLEKIIVKFKNLHKNVFKN